MPRFLCNTEVRRPEDVIPFLAKRKLHWRKGYSAYELAYSWVTAVGIPPTVREVLDTCPEYRDAKLIDGIFERKTDLDGRGRASQTDLLALVRLREGHAVIGVEGKVEEPFGQLVRQWRDHKPNKERRLTSLCATLGLDPENVADLRYQLLHRSSAAIYEARRHGWNASLMLVHSFSRKQTSLDDFLAFAKAIGAPLQGPDAISSSRTCEGVEFRLGWVSDTPRQ